MTLSVQALARLEARAAEMRAAGVPFALATVVRTLAATSARPGAKALLDAEGVLLEGWLGGGCARAAVAQAARAALVGGQPRLVSLRPEEVLAAEGVDAGEERTGRHYARNGCPSKGSMDIFVEPVLPLPRLAIFGSGPVASALADLAGRFDFHRILVTPDASPDAVLPAAEEHVTGPTLPATGPAALYVVVATQGRGDSAALRAALASGAGHTAFVGSRRKFATLAGRLAQEGVDPGALARVEAPAGLDINAITPEEIALSILARLIALRRAGGRGNPAPEG